MRTHLGSLRPARGGARLRSPFVAVAVGVLLAGAGAAPAQVRAGPAPQVWLDRPAPGPDALPGSLLTVGFVLWEPSGRTFVGGTFPFARLRPAAGDATPVKVAATEDWPGHYLARLTVPDGGAGMLEIGAGGTACDASGCQAADASFPVTGVGPPPDATLPQVAAARIEGPSEAVTAGDPTDVDIVVVPRADWDPATIARPDALFLLVALSRGANLPPVPASLVDPVAGRYRARVSFPDPGDYVLRVATSANPGRDDTFSTALLTLSVAARPAPPVVGTAEGLDPIVIIGLAAVALLLALVAGGGIIGARRAGRA